MERTGTLINKTYRNLLVSTLAMTASMYLSSIIDGILVGQILGTLELSAINLTYSISFLKNILIAMFTWDYLVCRYNRYRYRAYCAYLDASRSE